jgi:hypothetical protein
VAVTGVGATITIVEVSDFEQENKPIENRKTMVIVVRFFFMNYLFLFFII